MDIAHFPVDEARWFPVSAEVDIGAARRGISRFAAQYGFGERDVCRVATIATELGTNLVKYAEGPKGIWWAPQPSTNCPVAALVSVDSGPGIPDIELAVRDGVSDGGTMGVGLGGVTRLADTSCVFSSTRRFGSDAPVGTIVMAEVGAWEGEPHVIRRRLQGESACGDGHWVGESGGLLAVVDGLGHGPGAAEATAAAIAALDAAEWKEPLEHILVRVDAAVRGTRGVAMSIARLQERCVEWVGVGNVSARIAQGSTQHLIPRGGTLGALWTAPRVMSVERPHGGMLVMASDGVSDRWSFSDLGADSLHPLVLAALLHRDRGRERDDATVLVARV